MSEGIGNGERKGKERDKCYFQIKPFLYNIAGLIF